MHARRTTRPKPNWIVTDDCGEAAVSPAPGAAATSYIQAICRQGWHEARQANTFLFQRRHRNSVTVTSPDPGILNWVIHEGDRRTLGIGYQTENFGAVGRKRKTRYSSVRQIVQQVWL